MSNIDYQNGYNCGYHDGYVLGTKNSLNQTELLMQNFLNPKPILIDIKDINDISLKQEIIFKYNFTPEKIIELLSKLGDIKIRFSNFTKKNYVILEGFSYICNYHWNTVKGVLHHEETPEKAIESFFRDLINSDEIVMNIDSMNRYNTLEKIKIYKFFNNDFVDITKERIKCENDALYDYFSGKPNFPSV